MQKGGTLSLFQGAGGSSGSLLAFMLLLGGGEVQAPFWQLFLVLQLVK